MGKAVYDIIEPENYDERLKAVIAKRRRFPYGWMRDSDALMPIPFAAVPLVGIGASVYAGMQSGFVMPLYIIIAVCAVIAVTLVLLSYILHRKHAAEPVREDMFVVGDVLYIVSWVEYRQKYGKSGKGIVRIHAIQLDECLGYHNEKDGVVWIVPKRTGALRDVWYYGHHWDEHRKLCEKLIKSKSSTKYETDPFIGVYDEFADFLSEIGIAIEETDVPVDFLAGTAHGILSRDGE